VDACLLALALVFDITISPLKVMAASGAATTEALRRPTALAGVGGGNY
jgi:hypothetical protein